ncbi:hypothetical protein MRX96_045088 [Rhipicephalus microplus]
MVVFGGLLALLSLPDTAVGAAADMAIANMDGSHRDPSGNNAEHVDSDAKEDEIEKQACEYPADSGPGSEVAHAVFRGLKT